MNRSTFLAGALAAAASYGPARAREPLAQLLRPAIDSIPGTVGIYARTMAFGPPLVSYNASLSFPSASTIKMLIMLTAFEAAERNPAVMRRRITYNSDQLIGGSDFMQEQADGSSFTVHELIVPMIQLSDNTASNMLITHFGFDAINSVTRAAGLHDTHLRRHFMDFVAIGHHMDNRTTPADMAHLLFEMERAIREGMKTIASEKSCRQMIAIMLGQTDRDTIPAGLPARVAVANKTGELSRSRSDVAIVDPYGDSPYVLCVYTNGLDSPGESYSGITQISRLVYGRVAGSDL